MFEGVLTKMSSEGLAPVNYYLVFENDFLHFNQLFNKKITLEFLRFECLNCHLDRPIYRQGFCKQCFFNSAGTGDWILRPELSMAHLGKEDRDLEYEKEMQLQPHIVYLANSSNVKVGVTRKSQVPTRWIDQGAHQAIEILETPNRYLAGITEVALKGQVSDKTNWRKMVSNQTLEVDLLEEKNRLASFIPDETQSYFLSDHEKITEIQFPVLAYPEKVKSLNLLKTLSYQGILKGIKGQYLIFEDDTVFNIRANEGLVVKIDLDNS